MFLHKCITTQNLVKNKADRKQNGANFQIFLHHVVSISTTFFSPTLQAHN